jgi:predicted AAA+ superfamily ATPase
MNNFQPTNELYYERWLTPLLQKAILTHPVVVVTGARQVGKSTLLRHALPFREWRYHTFDDFDRLRQAQEDPQSLWSGTQHVVLDEVQRVPQLLSAVKQAVDQPGNQLRFILSGSANLLLMQQISESLAGRAVYFVLHPLTLGEIHRVPPSSLLNKALHGEWPAEQQIEKPLPEIPPLLLRGFLPRLWTMSQPEAWLRWWDGYISTYLERDLRQVAQIDALVDFRRVMELLALRSGQLVNQSDLGRDAQVSQSTVHRYLNLLEATHLFERLPAYTASHTTRLLKSPKAFWLDPGLAVFLSGYYDESALKNSREFGSYFETLIFFHLRALVSLMTPRARLYFWRTQQGAEVDFVVEHGRQQLAIEVKTIDNPSHRHTNGIRKFLADHPTATGGLLLHCGPDVKRLADNIVAVPWTLLTG